MPRDINIHVMEFGYHQNGAAGQGYYALLFRWRDEAPTAQRWRTMLATVFQQPGMLAVVEVHAGEQGSIRLTKNAWRGEDFEAILREKIETYTRVEASLYPADTWLLPTPVEGRIGNTL